MKPGKVNYLVRWDDPLMSTSEFIQFQAICDIREEDMPELQQEKAGEAHKQ